jgi:hypothetical protein
MVVLGLCYVVCGQNGRMTSVTAMESKGPRLCALGVISEFAFGYAGYFVVNAIWPNFYYTPIDARKWTWLGVQGICIVVYIADGICAYAGINRLLENATATSATARLAPYAAS